MQVTETATQGLRREYKVVVGKTDLDARLSTRLEELKGQVRLKGFRPGKVPTAHLRRTFGKAVMADIIQETVSEASQQAIEEKKLRPAQQPKIELSSEVDKVVDGKEDLAFTISLEVMPEFAPVDAKTLKLERLTADVDDADVQAALKRLADQQRSFAPRADGEAAAEGDAVTIDFVGRINGVAFEGGKADGFQLVIGSGRFIEGFEPQLVGVKAGDKRDVKVKFPDDYGSKELAGQNAVFEVSVREVAAPEEQTIDDSFAAKLGVESLDKLRETISSQIKGDYSRASRAHLKRALLDALDAAHTFDLPPGMVDQEFEQIWQAVQAELKRENKTAADEGKSEDDLKAEYRAIAERRVRLGLVLAEIGRINNIQISQDELTRAVSSQARQYPGQEKQIFEFYQKNPSALAQLRAPIYEEKVVDHVLGQVQLNDRTVSKDDLFSDPDELTERQKAGA